MKKKSEEYINKRLRKLLLKTRKQETFLRFLLSVIQELKEKYPEEVASLLEKQSQEVYPDLTPTITEEEKAWQQKNSLSISITY